MIRFAAFRRPNDYSNAGRIIANEYGKIQAASANNRIDYSGINNAAMNIEAEKKINAINNASKIVQSGIQSGAKVKIAQQNIDSEKDALKRNRKAGKLAAIGTLAQSLGSKSKMKRPLAPSNIDYSSLIEEAELRAKELKKKMEKSNAKNNTTSNTSAGDDPGKVATGTTDMQIGSSLEGNRKIVADAVAETESGPFGYEAFNQGGAAGGTKVIGKSGSYKDVFGTSLTDMTLDEIFYKQNTKERGLSMAEHLNSGGLHAVGRYQFIGPTLQDEVRRMGLPGDTKFTPEVQDQIFFSHLKRIGNISPWVGPSINLSKEEKERINSMIPGL